MEASVKEDDALPSEPEGQTNLFHCFTGFLFSMLDAIDDC